MRGSTQVDQDPSVGSSIGQRVVVNRERNTRPALESSKFGATKEWKVTVWSSIEKLLSWAGCHPLKQWHRPLLWKTCCL